MTDLDYKIKDIFPEESMHKTPDRYSFFSGVNVPSFIKDWLIKKFSNDDEVDTEGLYDFIQKHIPTKDSNIRSKLLNGDVIQILARIIFESDLKSGEYRFQIPDIGIKSGEGKVSPYLARQEGLLKEGENWGVVTMQYVEPDGKEKGYAEMVKFKPFRPYKPDFEYYCQAREQFTLEEWVDFLICSMEYNPNSVSFESLDQKLLFLTRLLVFVEPNLNMIELAPKGTGKSYIFNNLSKYGWQISGGKITRAKLFYDMSKNTPGIIPSYEFVSLDEVKTISFDNPEEIQGALKNYMEQGSFTVGKSKLTSLAGIILLGNIDLDANKRPLNNHYFEELPEAFQDHALIDRFHGFIEGWYLPRISEDLKLNGYSLNVEYFSEILSYTRTQSFYSAIVKELLDIPKNADTRDTNAVIKMCSGYLKLLYPHVRSASDISPQEFKMVCFDPAFEKRKIIRQQLAAIDREFTDRMPDIRVRGL